MPTLDTSLLIDLIRHDPEAMRTLDAMEREGLPLATTAINALELYRGAFLSASVQENLREVEAITRALIELPITDETYRIFGTLAAELRGRGSRIGNSDEVVAAITLGGRRRDRHPGQSLHPRSGAEGQGVLEAADYTLPPCGAGSRTERAKNPQTATARRKLTKNPGGPKPLAATMIPVTRGGPAECPISMMDDNAPHRSPPICSSSATSATYALVATVESDIPRARKELMRRNAGNPGANGMAATETPQDEEPYDDLDPLVDPVGDPAEGWLRDRDDQRLGGEQDPPRLVGTHPSGEDDKRQERLKRSEGKVSPPHIHECRCPQPPVREERHKTFPKR